MQVIVEGSLAPMCVLVGYFEAMTWADTGAKAAAAVSGPGSVRARRAAPYRMRGPRPVIVRGSPR